jgi:hypothetical protein
MSEEPVRKDSVEQLPTQKTAFVTDELNRILAILRGVAPKDADISFDFDGRLEVHIDVRNSEDRVRLEQVLPTLGGGIFCCMERANTPNRPFFHRVTARVDR